MKVTPSMRLPLALWYGSPLAILFIAFVGCGAKERVVAPEAPKVTVMHPEPRQLSDHEEFNGWMAADKTVEVRARVRGHIQRIAFTDGQYVKKGDLLFELDPRPFQKEIGKASDSRKVLEAQLTAAEKEEARLKLLQTKGGASTQQVEKAEADRLALEAQISAIQNEVERTQLDLEYSRITADIDGRVGKAEMSEGNLVNAGGSDPLLTTIVAVDPIRIYFNVDERSMQRYAKSAGAAGKNLSDLLANLKDRESTFTFALDGELGFEHLGTLRFGDNRVDPSTGTIQLYGTVPNAKGMFVPGSRVRVRLTIGQPYAALLVPDTAILSDQDKRYILIVDGEKTVRRRNVALGTITDDGLRSVTPADKLAGGETAAQWLVIVDNLQRARLKYPVDAQMASVPISSR
ncbi:MAG: efflux RND transporter periplasmic adaptor subunit [Pirellulales bacterium]|nr:efflux RND transporter periplasmic adaptor subunit [Pirellulales bacterium]